VTSNVVREERTVSVPTRPTPTPVGSTAVDDDVAARLITADDPGWDAARAAWNLAVDQRPAAVVHARTPADLAAIVRHVVGSGRRVAVQSTGHGASTLRTGDDVVLVRTGAMVGVEVDAVAQRARVLAGTRVGDLVDAAAADGLAFLAGSTGDVGVAGYTLGGGVGWLARRYGLACNDVTALEVVTADGEVRRVDADHDPELFWALRGGGGSFGAVASLEVALHPVREVYAGQLMWPIERAPEVLHAWRAWTGEVPDTTTSIARLLRFPPLPDLAPHLRGRRFVAVEAACLRPAAAADRSLRALRALRPEIDTFATIPVAGLGQLHGDPDQPVPALADHRLLGEVPSAAIDAVLEAAGPDAVTPLLAVDLRHLGGALARSRPDHGVLDRVDADAAVFAVGLPVGPDLAAAIPAAFDGLRAALAPWDAGRDLLNLADQPSDPARLFGDRAQRLRAVKAAYDPDHRFVANHPVT
jgi:FAD/FMN-containing dehydrogenase